MNTAGPTYKCSQCGSLINETVIKNFTWGPYLNEKKVRCCSCGHERIVERKRRDDEVPAYVHKNEDELF